VSAHPERELNLRSGFEGMESRRVRDIPIGLTKVAGERGGGQHPPRRRIERFRGPGEGDSRATHQDEVRAAQVPAVTSTQVL